jgi:hypothetical protein
MNIVPVRRYRPADDLWIVTSYYNPLRYRTRRANFDAYRAAIETSGLNHLVIECAFGSQPFSLSPECAVLQIRCRHVLWQKERLLNVAVAALPKRCTKVAWLDCDVLFENPDWAVEVSDLLERVPLAQPFQHSIRLPRGDDCYKGRGVIYEGFCAACLARPGVFLTGQFERHGHTGFGWAARRELLERADLYDV